MENVMRRMVSPVILVLALFLTGCPATVVRESKVFKTELTWFTSAATQQANHLTHFVATHPQCVCNEAKTAYIDPQCQKAAKTALTALHRAPWHRDMALYNAGMLKERPSKEPPVIPPVALLCKGGEVD